MKENLLHQCDVVWSVMAQYIQLTMRLKIHSEQVPTHLYRVVFMCSLMFVIICTNSYASVIKLINYNMEHTSKWQIKQECWWCMGFDVHKRTIYDVKCCIPWDNPTFNQHTSRIEHPYGTNENEDCKPYLPYNLEHIYQYKTIRQSVEQPSNLYIETNVTIRRIDRYRQHSLAFQDLGDLLRDKFLHEFLAVTLSKCHFLKYSLSQGMLFSIIF